MTVKNADLQARKNAATPRGVGVMCDFYAARAGIAGLNTGHRHPKIVKAIADQLNNFTHTAYQIVPYASYVELAEKINDRAPVVKNAVFFGKSPGARSLIFSASSTYDAYGTIW
jgi:4-aminobutyrate aminotransferase